MHHDLLLACISHTSVCGMIHIVGLITGTNNIDRVQLHLPLHAKNITNYQQDLYQREDEGYHCITN